MPTPVQSPVEPVAAPAHSPAPWKRIDPDGRSVVGLGYRIRTADGSQIVAEQRCDVPLIEAAPDLLRAVEKLLMWHEDPEADDHAWSVARDALAKARGEVSR